MFIIIATNVRKRGKKNNARFLTQTIRLSCTSLLYHGLLYHDRFFGIPKNTANRSDFIIEGHILPKMRYGILANAIKPIFIHRPQDWRDEEQFNFFQDLKIDYCEFWQCLHKVFTHI